MICHPKSIKATRFFNKNKTEKQPYYSFFTIPKEIRLFFVLILL